MQPSVNFPKVRFWFFIAAVVGTLFVIGFVHTAYTRIWG